MAVVSESGFAGGDQEYLRDVQYRDGAKLAARANLHIKYGTAATPWFVWVVNQLGWPRAAEVLEVGCGPGWLWVEAAPELPSDLELMLTDLTTGMVNEAVARVGESGRFRFVQARVVDAQELPFEDASFDVAVANHMLYHVPDPGRAVAELARVLRPTGTLIAAANGRRNLAELWAIRAKVFDVSPVPETTERFGRESGEAMLRSRFRVVAWHDYPDELLCTDPADVMAFLTSSPPGEDASTVQRDRLADEVRARFEADDGTLRVSKKTGLFLCRAPLRHDGVVIPRC